MQEHLAELRQILAGDDQRPFATVDLHPIAAAGERNGADMHGRDGAVRQPAAEQHVVGRGDVEQLVGAGLEPLLRLRRDHGGQPAKSPTTKRIASMVWPLAMVSVFAPSVTSRCQVRCDGRVSTPSRIRLGMHRHNLADEARLEQFLHIQQRRVDPRLQPDRGDQPLRPGERRQLFASAVVRPSGHSL